MKKLAAIDIGTNSIKLLVAAVDEAGVLEVLAREKTPVRLGNETLATGRLSPEAIEAGTSAIEQFVRSIEAQKAELARAVATCAVREAENSQEFLEAVRRRTGIAVDVISGEEEARLIHLAARSEFSSRLDPIFVVDIGGGSTEFVVSDGPRVLMTESLPLGAVRLAALVRDDPPSERDRKAVKKAIRAAAKRAAQTVRKTGFKTCVGSAGTIQSLSLVHEAAVLGREPIPSGHRTLTRAGLRRVNRILRKTTQKEKLRVPGLDPRRRDIAVPGGMLLAWILKNTRAGGIVVGERGLREGIILDYAARHGRKQRSGDRDVRARSVDRLLRRANAEILHATHVARLALELFDQTHALHQLTAAEREWLQYGALLHDVGCSIGFSRHQQHSYYLITHGDLTGFSAEEIEVIASVARYHKGKGPSRSHENWKRLDPYLRPVVEKLAALLRIADGLDRSHRQLVADVVCRVRPRRVELDAAARGDCEAELEAARRKGKLFQKVFDRKPVFRAVPAGREEAVLQRDLEMISAEALWS